MAGDSTIASSGSGSNCSYSYVYTITALLILCYYIASSFRAYWKLRHFNGPTLAAWSDIWWIWAAINGETHLRLSEVSSRYGPMARIGPNTLLTCDEEMFKRMNNPRIGYRKTDWYKAFRFGAEHDNIVSETDNDARVHIRNRTAPGFTGRDHPGFEALIDKVILSLVDSLNDRYVSTGSVVKKPLDLAVKIQFMTLDIVTGLLFGEPFGWVTTDTDMYEYIGVMNANFPVVNFISVVPAISRLLRVPWIQRFLSPSMKDRTGMGRFKAVSSEIIMQRLSELKNAETQSPHVKRQDMVASFISHGLNHDELVATCLIAMLAGSDTVATVMRSGLVFILTQPRILRTLQAECDKADVPHDQIISRARALQLPYLQACCKESLRYHPAATGLLPRVVPPEGDHYDGKFIPGGTEIAQCAWNLHRHNIAAYGSDADSFRPERWIEATAAASRGQPERLNRMDSALELAFSYGGSKCLGQRIALLELPKLIFELTRRFELGLVNGMKPMEKNLNYGLFYQEGMWINIRAREDHTS